MNPESADVPYEPEASPETCDPVAEEAPEVDFEQLDDSQKIMVLRDVLGEALQRLTIIEGSLVRILMAAGEIEDKPKMVIPGKHAAHKTRNSR